MNAKRNRLRRLTLLLCVVAAACCLPCCRVAHGQGSNSRLHEVLRRRGAALQGQVDAINGRLQSVSQRLPTIADAVERLRRQVEAIELPEPPEEIDEPEEPPVRNVQFRPPLLREVDLETPLAIVCKNGRAAILDLELMSENRAKLFSSIQDLIASKGGTIKAGDFDIQVKLVETADRYLISQEAVQTNPGETPQRALSADSKLQKQLAKLDAKRAAIQFAVYPDSFAAFREVRGLLRDRGFAIHWIPMPHGEKISIGSGSAQAQ